ncbi:type III-B CRISPR module RAMP protein Cmr1 [Hydrogenothermus marinus]|uniref:CRISPR type III-B/RAMP module RAMP protein Cmr1 n=1 Tax=Hydrogenothermus marinus TaxID=133270 RepID=A0A3M0BKL7_9AQUI|nr:type III-B CRISPR module RAMP protein Cmr1 [Hydrogenothermus marinus]RMA96964.1 CRISPR type III-B/RAMP module RAMP protein Cmr1 [Hydrogenothermus marinus]
MKEITLTVKTITPTLMGGAFSQNDGIRPSEIKAIMRFAFRLVAGKYIEHNKEGLIKLKEKESLIFGSTNQKSIFSLIVKNQSLDIKKIALLPHKNGFKNKRDMISPNSKFDLKIQVKRPINKDISIQESLDFFKALLNVASLIGIGYRKNRFNGNLELEKFSLSEEVEKIDNICKALFNESEKDIDVPLFPVLAKKPKKVYKVFSIPLKKPFRQSLNYEEFLKKVYENVIHEIESKSDYSCLLGSAKKRQGSLINFSIYNNKIFIFSFFYKDKNCFGRFNEDKDKFYKNWQKGTEEVIEKLKDNFGVKNENR